MKIGMGRLAVPKISHKAKRDSPTRWPGVITLSSFRSCHASDSWLLYYFSGYAMNKNLEAAAFADPDINAVLQSHDHSFHLR